MQSDNENPLEFYVKKQYHKLAFCNLKKPINSDGDTIMHKIAENHDKDAVQELSKNNPKINMESVINVPNKRMQLPIHKAMDAVKNGNCHEFEFVTYMIQNLGANPNIPDEDGRIIDQTDEKLTSNLSDANKKKIQELNEMVIKNVKNLTKLVNLKSEDFNSALSENTESGETAKINFIKNLINLYDSAKQKGGFNGRRKINSNFYNKLDETNNDSFQIGDKNKLFNNYAADRNNSESQQLKNKILFGGQDDYTNQSENRFNINTEDLSGDETRDNQLMDIRDRQDNRQQGRRDELNQENENLENIRHGLAKDTRLSEILHTQGGQIIQEKIDLGSRQKGGRDNTSDNYRMDTDDLENLFDTEKSAPGGNQIYSDSFSNPDRPRPRNQETDEMYRSFVKKIMDLLGTDEKTAKFYRAAIKINLQKAKPELRKIKNDELKVKEMEPIFENKERLQDELDKIDMDEIKKIMAETSEARQRRQEEFRKNRENRPNKTNGEPNKSTRDLNKSSDDQGDIVPDSSSEEVPKKRKTKKTTTAKGGYLKSEEILLSPDY